MKKVFVVLLKIIWRGNDMSVSVLKIILTIAFISVAKIIADLIFKYFMEGK